jgi:hypothetical protein
LSSGYVLLYVLRFGWELVPVLFCFAAERHTGGLLDREQWPAVFMAISVLGWAAFAA